MTREQCRFVELFGQVPWFATLPVQARELLAAGCSWRSVAGGEALFFEGEASDAVYLLVNGSLAAFQRDGRGISHAVGQIMAGESVGELGVLISRPRSATVRALRDSELIRLPAAHLELLAEGFPQALLGLARLALRRQGELQPHGAAPRTLALLPHSPGVVLAGFAAMLAQELLRFGSVRVLRAEDAGHDAGHYHAIEHASRFVLYVGDGMNSEWRDQCRRQADASFVVRADESPTLDAVWPDATDEAVERRQFLVIEHDGPARPGAARRWHAFCPRAAIHHLRHRAFPQIARAWPEPSAARAWRWCCPAAARAASRTSAWSRRCARRAWRLTASVAPRSGRSSAPALPRSGRSKR